MMFRSWRVAAVCGVLLGLCAASTAASQVTHMVTRTTDKVRFGAGVAKVGGSGSDLAFTIRCDPRSGTASTDMSWLRECNRLGRAALDHAVASHLIAPVSGVPFVAAASLDGMPPSARMGGFVRRIPLAE